MKTSSFVKWQLKKWLPLFAVLSIVVLAVITINACSYSLIKMVSGSRNSLENTLDEINLEPRYSGLQLITSMMAFIVFIIPFFVFSHRFDKNAADAYKAFPAPKHKITRTKILIGGAFILGLTIIAYWMFVAILGIRYSTTPEMERIDWGYIIYRCKYYFIWYLPAFFYLTISLLTSYLFNCTLVSFGNNGVASFIYLLLGNIIMFLGVFSLMYAFVYLPSKVPYNSQLYYMFHTSGISWYGTLLGRNDFLDDTFNSLVLTNDVATNVTREGFFSLGRIIGYLTFAAEIAVGVLAFFTKEPSGEYYGAAGARKESDKCIVYTGMGVILLALADLMSSNGLDASDFLIFIFIATLLYFTLVIFNKRFSLNFTETIVIISLGLFYIVSTIYVRIIDPHTVYYYPEYYEGAIKYGLQAFSSIL